MNRSLFLCAALSFAGATTTLTLADVTPAPSAPLINTSGYNNGSLHVNGGLEFTTADFFRGIRQPENSPVFQPYVDLHLNMINDGDFRVGAFAGAMGSGSEKSHNGQPLLFYEDDFFAGGELSYRSFRFAAIYREYHSPAGAFGSITEAGATLEWDDRAFMREQNIPFSLNPHVSFYRELLDQNHGVVSVRSQPNKLNSYLEVGIRPEVKIDIPNWPVTIGVPVTAGGSWDNYYKLTPTAKSNAFGFISAGVMASVPLPFPASWGQWDLHGGATFVHDFAQGARQINHGHPDFTYGGAGIGFKY